MEWMKVKLLLPLHTSRNMVGMCNNCTIVFDFYASSGVLMHFDSLELKNFYFVNPQWLCNVFTHVILLSANQSKF